MAPFHLQIIVLNTWKKVLIILAILRDTTSLSLTIIDNFVKPLYFNMDWYV